MNSLGIYWRFPCAAGVVARIDASVLGALRMCRGRHNFFPPRLPCGGNQASAWWFPQETLRRALFSSIFAPVEDTVFRFLPSRPRAPSVRLPVLFSAILDAALARVSALFLAPQTFFLPPSPKK